MAHFRTHEEGIANVLDAVETKRGEGWTHLQLLVGARQLAAEVRKLQGELTQERYAYSQLASENADLADEVARLRARDEAGAAVVREFTRNGFWAPGTELRAVLDALVRAHGQEGL